MRIDSLFPEPSQRPEPRSARRADAPSFDLPEPTPRRDEPRARTEPRERWRAEGTREEARVERRAERSPLDERRAEPSTDRSERSGDARAQPPREPDRIESERATSEAVSEEPEAVAPGETEARVDAPTNAAPDDRVTPSDDTNDPTPRSEDDAPLVVPGEGDGMRAEAATAALLAAGHGEAKPSAAPSAPGAETAPPPVAAPTQTETGSSRSGAVATGAAPAASEAAALGTGSGGTAGGSTGGETGSGEGDPRGRGVPTAPSAQTGPAAPGMAQTAPGGTIEPGAQAAPTAQGPAADTKPASVAATAADTTTATDGKLVDAKPAAQIPPQPSATGAPALPTVQPVIDPGLAQAAMPPPGAATTTTPAGAPPAGAAPQPQPPVVANVPLGAVPFEIGLKSLGGVDTFTIRLDPEELGRVDVTLEIADGEVSAKLLVERPETLALLQRDARALERAFEQAGLRTTDQSVQMSLRDEGRGGDGRGEPGGFGREGDGRGERGRENGEGRGHDERLARRPEIEALVASRLRPGVLGGVDVRI